MDNSYRGIAGTKSTRALATVTFNITVDASAYIYTATGRYSAMIVVNSDVVQIDGLPYVKCSKNTFHRECDALAFAQELADIELRNIVDNIWKRVSITPNIT